MKRTIKISKKTFSISPKKTYKSQSPYGVKIASAKQNKKA